MIEQPTTTPAAPATPLPRPFAPLAAEQSLEISNPDTARAFGLADSLIARNPELRERVVEGMKADGHDTYSPDDRTPSQRAWDAEHGIPRVVEAESYAFTFPPDVGVEAAHLPAFNNDLRQLGATLGYGQKDGSALIQMLVRATAEQGREPDLTAAAERHEASIRAVVGPKYDQMAAAINSMLDELGGGARNQKLVAALRPGGVLSTPWTFVTLAHRAGRLAAWRDGRPS